MPVGDIIDNQNELKYIGKLKILRRRKNLRENVERITSETSMLQHIFSF